MNNGCKLKNPTKQRFIERPHALLLFIGFFSTIGGILSSTINQHFTYFFPWFYAAGIVIGFVLYIVSAILGLRFFRHWHFLNLLTLGMFLWGISTFIGSMFIYVPASAEIVAVINGKATSLSRQLLIAIPIRDEVEYINISAHNLPDFILKNINQQHGDPVIEEVVVVECAVPRDEAIVRRVAQVGEKNLHKSIMPRFEKEFSLARIDKARSMPDEPHTKALQILLRAELQALGLPQDMCRLTHIHATTTKTVNLSS